MAQKRMIQRGKKAQATIFIVVALIIVAVVLAILLYPKLKGGGEIDAIQNPQTYLENCLKTPLKSNLEKLGPTGGEFEPTGYVQYNGTKIKYLCHTSQYYSTCVIQEPLIKEKMEQTLTGALKQEVERCVKDLQNEYEKKGWKVSASQVSSDVSIVLDSIIININSPMTLSKDVSKTYRSFSISIPSKMYEILYIASNIVEYEATFGDADTTVYLRYYPNVNIYKNQLGDGTVIYRVENVVTKESFTFASRSLPWPAGLGIIT